MKDNSHTAIDMHQVQEAKCVKGYGLTGDLLALDGGAKCDYRNSTTCNKVSYSQFCLSYPLRLWHNISL